MGLRHSRQTLEFALVGGCVEEPLMLGGVKLLRNELLRTRATIRDSIRQNPFLFRSGAGLVPTCSKGTISVLNSLAQTKTPKGRSETSLGVHSISHGATNNGF